MTLRPAGEEDSERVMAWRNDPDAVRFSVTGRPVTSEEHRAWFARLRSHGSRSHLWIAEERGAPVGQVRVDVDGDVGTVSIAVAPDRRGQGLGTAMLRAVSGQAPGALALTRLVALVRVDNPASLRAFEAAGFHRAGVARDAFLELEWP